MASQGFGADAVPWEAHQSKRQRLVEAAVLNLSGMVWHADNALLPAVYLEVSREFAVGPAELGMLTCVRGVTEALFAFPAGFAADATARPKLIFQGVLLWSLGLAGCACATSFRSLVLFRMVNGVGLGLVQPLVSSLVADTNAPGDRGLAFGILQFTGNVGTGLGSFLATCAGSSIILGIAGWRLVLFFNVLISVVVGSLVFACIDEPRQMDRKDRPDGNILSLMRSSLPVMCRIFRVRTFLVIRIGQGIFGSSPWFALSYTTMWLELLCFSHQDAATILVCFTAGAGMGGVIGGRMLDIVRDYFPDHGPAWMAMFSVGSGVPLFAFIFFGVGGAEDATEKGILPFGASFLFAGVLMSWCGLVNASIFSEVVPSESYTYIYALDRTLEGSFAALATPAVGIVTERIFSYSALGELTCSPERGVQLAEGMFTICFVGWSLCFVFYSLLHLTYPRDRRLAGDCARVESEARASFKDANGAQPSKIGAGEESDGS